jgi:hypothetical protein
LHAAQARCAVPASTKAPQRRAGTQCARTSRIKEAIDHTLSALCVPFADQSRHRSGTPRINGREEEPEELGAADDALTGGRFTFFTIRHDERKCVSPLCGGFFLKRVNRSTTICADDTRRNECYVAELDLARLGATPEQEGQLVDHAGQFLVRGSILAKRFPSFGNLGVFRADEAWQGHENVTASGTFSRVGDAGIVCITFPCLSFTGEKLNSSRPIERIAGVDLEGIVPDPSDGRAQLDQPFGLMVAGHRVAVVGPAGRAHGIDASEYYLPFPRSRACGTIAGLRCESGEFCDFGAGQCQIADAGGVCRPRPELCLQIFDPVCGCDKKTYSNACEANAAGAQIDHAGECAK